MKFLGIFSKWSNLSILTQNTSNFNTLILKTTITTYVICISRLERERCIHSHYPEEGKLKCIEKNDCLKPIANKQFNTPLTKQIRCTDLKNSTANSTQTKLILKICYIPKHACNQHYSQATKLWLDSMSVVQLEQHRIWIV
jgi:hypothetical protein